MIEMGGGTPCELMEGQLRSVNIKFICDVEAHPTGSVSFCTVMCNVCACAYVCSCTLLSSCYIDMYISSQHILQLYLINLGT